MESTFIKTKEDFMIFLRKSTKSVMFDMDIQNTEQSKYSDILETAMYRLGMIFEYCKNLPEECRNTTMMLRIIEKTINRPVFAETCLGYNLIEAEGGIYNFDASFSRFLLLCMVRYLECNFAHEVLNVSIDERNEFYDTLTSVLIAIESLNTVPPFDKIRHINVKREYEIPQDEIRRLAERRLRAAMFIEHNQELIDAVVDEIRKGREDDD